MDEAIKSGNDNILLFLLSCGLKFSSNTSQASLLSSSLVQPALKVCVLGNSESGKSTLVKALMSNLVEGGWFNSILYPRVTGVEPHTAGIIPYHAHSPKCGRFILYDFAGQYEHYSSSHAAILQISNVLMAILSLSLLTSVKVKNKLFRSFNTGTHLYQTSMGKN